jgi:hypothetical protein
VVEAECFRQFVVQDDTAVRLIHAGRQLDPKNSLQQYRIEDDHTIHVVFTQRQPQDDYSRSLVQQQQVLVEREQNRRALERLQQQQLLLVLHLGPVTWWCLWIFRR